MNKELNNMLEELKEKLVELISEDFDKKQEKVSKMIRENINKPSEIIIKGNENGKTEVTVNGERLALIINLAGSLDNILKTLKVDEDTFNAFRNVLDSKEVK